MPIRHGMTLGELARLFNGENKIGADLTVFAMKNWRREDWFDDTALPWISPSPNMRNLNEATCTRGSARLKARTSRLAAVPIRRLSTSALRGSTA